MLNSLLIGLRVNASIQDLDFRFPRNLSPDVSRQVVQMIESNTALRKFRGMHCQLEEDRDAIHRYWALNRFGRCLLLRDKVKGASHVPPGLWPCVLARMAAADCDEYAMDALFYFLQRLPRPVFPGGIVRARNIVPAAPA